jgi:hypothetical protein
MTIRSRHHLSESMERGFASSSLLQICTGTSNRRLSYPSASPHHSNAVWTWHSEYWLRRHHSPYCLLEAARINASTVPAVILWTKPETRSGLSLAQRDCSSLNDHVRVNVPDLRLRFSAKTPALARSVSDSPPRSCGEDQRLQPVARLPSQQSQDSPYRHSPSGLFSL